MTEPRFDNIPLGEITPSATNPRKNFDPAKLEELAESIKVQGVAQPILVRPLPAATKKSSIRYEIVAGERRFRASKMAEKATIPAVIRELSDADALEIQVIENLQRQDLHELEEAEGYDQLMKLHNMTADDLVAKIGKSRSYIYGRLKLLALEPEARTAFYDGKLPASTALLVSRIPVKALQIRAVSEITDSDSKDPEPMSVREAARHIQSKYMLQLTTASFDTTDKKLLASAGPCTTCPKRTGNQPELFSDIESTDVCTDPECFAEKRLANVELIKAAAIKNGQTVIEGDEAKEVQPYNYGNHVHLQKGFERLDSTCYQDEERRTYREILGDGFKPTILVDAHNPAVVHEVFRPGMHKKEIEKNLKSSPAPEPSPKEQKKKKEEEEKRKAIEEQAEKEEAFRKKLFFYLREGTADRLAHHAVAETLDNSINLYDLFEIQGWEKNDETFLQRLAKMDATQLIQLIIDAYLIDDLEVSTWDIERNNQPEKLIEACGHLGIHYESIRDLYEKGEWPEPEKKAPAPKKAATAKKAPVSKTPAAKKGGKG